MTKRLYVGRIEVEYAAWVESEDEAIERADDVLRDLGYLPDHASADLIHFYSPTKGAEALPVLPDGWTMDDLVYHDGGSDMTLREALEKEKEARRAEKQTG